MARATRRLVLRRDHGRCTVCGSTENLEVHHIVRRTDGGSNDLANLVTLCKSCHSASHDRPVQSQKRAEPEEASPCDGMPPKFQT